MDSNPIILTKTWKPPMYLILSVCLIHLIACLSPGPDIFLVVLNSIRSGFKAGIATTAGILCGVTIQITVGISGISFLLEQNETVHKGMALLGSMWLAYLGIRGILSSRRHKPSNPESFGTASQAPGNGFAERMRDGFLVNILNPKALLYFLGLFSVMLGPDVPIISRIACAGAMLFVQAAAFSSVALLITRPLLKTKWTQFQHVLEFTLSTILLLLGLSICLTTLYSLLA
jgi:threonine efflux protein